MFLTYLCLIFIYSCGVLIIRATEDTEPKDNCMLSISIPKENLKAVCDKDQSYHTQQKFRSVESQLTTIRREMNDLHIRLTKMLSFSNQERNLQEITDKMQNLETLIIPKIEKSLADLQKDLGDENSGETDEKKMSLVEMFGRKRLARQIRIQIQKEMADIKGEVKQEIRNELIQEIKEEIRNELLSYTKRDSKLLNGINSEILLNTISDFNPEELEKGENEGRYKFYGAYYDTKPQYEERTSGSEEDFYRSATQNEFPENRHPHVLQDESKSAFELNRIIDTLQKEVKKHLDMQTKQVKDIVGKHLNQTVTKCENAAGNVDIKYERKLKSITEEIIKDERVERKFDRIENDIETIVQAIHSMRESRDEITDRALAEQQMLESYMKSTLEKSAAHLQDEIEYLKNQTGILSKINQGTAQLQRMTQFAVQHLNATFKLKTYFLEKNITRMAADIEQLNKTINPDYGDFDTDEALHQIDVEDTINFVKDFKDVWPTALDNITYLGITQSKSVENVDKMLENIKYQFNTVNNNHTDLRKSIQMLQQEVKDLQETIAYNAKVEKEAALEKNEWARYNFNVTFSGRSECFGDKKYVKRTGYKVGIYVGVVLCSSSRYKIYLADSLTDTFLDIGDTVQSGEDHCEFVGAAQNSSISIKNGQPRFESIPGYKRAHWGQEPVKSMLLFFSPTPVWYECGVTIP